MQQIKKLISGRVKFNEPLWRHTTFRIGGEAVFWFEPKNIQDLQRLIKFFKKEKKKFFIIGAGSNLLINDKGLDNVISLSMPFFCRLNAQGNYIWAAAGAQINRLIEFAKKSNLGYLEFLSGIPGTVGGAAVMNAGMWDKSIGDLIQEVLVMDKNGKLKTIKRDKLEFRYRYSNLTAYIVLRLKLKLQKQNKEEINQNLRNSLSYRLSHLDLSGPSAGCVFRNPKGESAGRLIDLCGLKGMRIGDAYISEKHANFIINSGHASAEDVSQLISLVRNRVKEKFGICLRPEIKIIS